MFRFFFEKSSINMDTIFKQNKPRASLPGKAAGQSCRAKLPGKSCRAKLPGKTARYTTVQDSRASLPG
jgi:hypothetical protein